MRLDNEFRYHAEARTCTFECLLQVNWLCGYCPMWGVTHEKQVRVLTFAGALDAPVRGHDLDLKYMIQA